MQANYGKIFFITIIVMLMIISISGCFFTNDKNPVSNQTIISDENSKDNSENIQDETQSLSQEEIKKIVAYIEYISLFEEISPFTSIEVVDYNNLVSRFFYMAETVTADELDESYEGRIAATIESVQEVIRTHVNPGITLPTNYDYQLDESLVVWLQDKGTFAWYGRGLPMNREIVYPLDGYIHSDGTITLRSIDLSTISTETYEEKPILEVFDKEGNMIGTFDQYYHIFEFDVDISVLPVSIYTFKRNGLNDYYLISKIQE